MFPYLIAGAIGFAVAKIFEEDEASKFADGGSVLLAPNGKPSNLTPEQYKLVRTPEFKAWFGDWQNDPVNASKVVDEETKEPLVLYHGTNKEVFVFKPKKFLVIETKEKNGFVYERTKKQVPHKAFYFTDRYDIAKDYAKDRIKSRKKGDINVVEVFLRISNPLRVDYLIHREKIDKIISQQNNYDGVLGKERFMGNEYNSFVAFEPNQIKLADGTNTTFDGNNPDIRFDGGGGINKTNPYIYDNPKLVKMIEDSIEKNGSSFICTYVASAVKMLEGSNVKIYGFSIYNNPDAEYFSDEEGDEGHHFAVLDDRYILDAWIYNNYQDYQANIKFNRSVFDLENKEDKKIIKYLYGNRNKWVDITKNVEDFKDLFPLTYKDLINGYKNL